MKDHAAIVPVALALSLIFNLQPAPACAQGTAFTYQGQLQNNGSPVSGPYDLEFTLFGTNSGGVAIAGPVTNSAVAVTNGLFTTTVDFGSGVFTGTNSWLDIAVRTNGGNAFTELTPRQPLTPAPYAVFAGSANAAGISGILPAGVLSGAYGNAVNLSNASNSFNGGFSGNGGGLTNVNAATVGGLTPANFWQTTGNTGTSPTNGNFLGTLDVQPVELRAGGLRALRLERDPRAVPEAANLIGGFTNNVIQQPGSGGDVIVGGGYDAGVNVIHSNSAGVFIGAGSANQIGPSVNDAVIAGGFGNNIGGDGYRSVIGGGNDNTNNEFDSVIGGGQNNFIQIAADHAFIGGGAYNTIVGSLLQPLEAAVIGGGQNNVIQTNTASCVIGGGYGNTIQSNAFYAVIPGGSGNVAGGTNSFAAGTSAQATNNGAFVWSDNSTTNPFSSTAANQFAVRATGGIQLVTGSSTGLTINGGTATFNTGAASLAIVNEYGFVPGITASSSSYHGHMRFRNALEIWPDTGGTNGGYLDVRNLAGIQTIYMSGTNGNITCTSLSQTSDRNAKQDFAPVSSTQMLDKVARLPISEWSYKIDSATRHIGPVAQDFYSIFNIGMDDKHIAPIDEGGVALAAIQGLNQKLDDRDAMIKQQAAEIADFKARLEKLELLIESKKGDAR